jgi:purine nucleosidase
MNMKKVLIDTDIGTDVDDLLALIYALKNPELDLVGVSTVTGDTKRRARIVSRVVSMLGRDVEVAPGNRYPIRGEYFEELYCLSDIDAKISPLHAEELITGKIKDPEISIAAIGPLTNVAISVARTAPLDNPLYLMGQSSSYNFRWDQASTNYIINSRNNKTLVTRDVSLKTYLTKEELFAINTGVKELNEMLKENATRWLDHSKYKTEGRFYLYDPLTVAAIAKPEILGYESRDGIKVATTVDGKAFKDHLIQVLEL